MFYHVLFVNDIVGVVFVALENGSGNFSKVGIAQLAWLVVVQFFRERVGDIAEAFQEERVEDAAFVIADHLKSLLVAERLLVATFASKCVVNVGNRDDLRTDGNFITLEAVGVAAAVPAFMVPTANVVGEFHQRLVLEELDGVEHLGAVHGVLLHDVEFFFRELAGLVQNLVGDCNLSDVVHRRCCSDGADFFFGDAVFASALEQCA